MYQVSAIKHFLNQIKWNGFQTPMSTVIQLWLSWPRFWPRTGHKRMRKEQCGAMIDAANQIIVYVFFNPDLPLFVTSFIVFNHYLFVLVPVGKKICEFYYNVIQLCSLKGRFPDINYKMAKWVNSWAKNILIHARVMAENIRNLD